MSRPRLREPSVPVPTCKHLLELRERGRVPDGQGRQRWIDAANEAREHVTGTDLDETALQSAARAVFPARALLDSAPPASARHFVVRPDGTASPSDRLKGLVRFARESLLDPIARRDLDLIVCRNVLIYFSLEHQERILSRFAEALSEGGYLVLGRVERLFGEARSQFDVVSARDRVYRRLPSGAAAGAVAHGGGGREEVRACA